MWNSFAKKRGPVLRELEIETVNHCLRMIRSLDERIKQLSKELKARAEKSEEAKLLMSIPSVGYFSPLTILAEIGDVLRFSDTESFTATPDWCLRFITSDPQGDTDELPSRAAPCFTG